MDSDFFQNYNGQRLDQYEDQPPMYQPDEEEEEYPIDHDYEIEAGKWQAIDVSDTGSWRPSVWSECPIRFVDGKDVGQTVAWLTAPGGYPIPIRLSEIGGIVMRVVNGELVREYNMVEKVVSFVTLPFPWEEIESLGRALQANDMRLISANPPFRKLSYDFELMRKAAQNRSNDEMGLIEEAAIAQANEIPTIVDGRLEPRSGGFDAQSSPVFGVVKTHNRTYLHPLGMRILYRLEPGQRTPVFSISKTKENTKIKLPVLSWYLRFSGSNGATPNYGIVRVEVSTNWFESRGTDWDFINRLSRLLYEYRCRQKSYPRAAISLHPIVRAEDSLRSLFLPSNLLASRFYKFTGL